MGNDYLNSFQQWGPSSYQFQAPTVPTLSNPMVNVDPAQMVNLDLPAVGGQGSGGGIFDGFFRAPDGSGGGWGLDALNTFSGLASTFMGIQQYGLAKKQLKENRRQFDLNFGAQRKLTNSRLEDRQRARVASNPGAYQSVASYMNDNRI